MRAIRTLVLVLLGLAMAVGLDVACAGRGEREPILLRDHENTIYSQAGEDGILEKIFEVIEPTRRFAIEFGAGDGVDMSNVRRLFVHQGWGGLLIEGDEDLAARARENYMGFAKVRAVQAWVYPANVELLFEENNVPRDLDLLVIDIDSNDYYVWRAIREYRPKVVMIECNCMFPPPQEMVIAFHPLMYWSGDDYHFGASIQSLYELGKRKGYELVGTNFKGVNLFFVDRPYFARFGLKDNSPAVFFRPYNMGVPFSLERIRKGESPPPSEDLVMPEVRIRKRFRFDR